MGRSRAHTELRDWMKRTERGFIDVAEALQISRAHLVHLTTGGRTPSLALALRITKLTGIPTSEWAKRDDVTGVSV